MYEFLAHIVGDYRISRAVVGLPTHLVERGNMLRGVCVQVILVSAYYDYEYVVLISKFSHRPNYANILMLIYYVYVYYL